MSKEKSYTITDITDLYGLQRATLYYRFKNQYKDYVVTNEEGVQALSQEGMDKMIKEYSLKTINEDQEIVYNEMGSEALESETYKSFPENGFVSTGYSEEQVDRIVSALEQQLKDKEDEIKRLHNRMESLDDNLRAALELNRNNQILLLKSEDKVKELENKFDSLKEEKNEEKLSNNDTEDRFSTGKLEKKPSFLSRLFRR